MLAFSENCDMLCTAEGLKPAPGALLGWTVCVCSALLLKQLASKQKWHVFQIFGNIREKCGESDERAEAVLSFDRLPKCNTLITFHKACYPVFRYYSMNKFRVIVMKFNCSLQTWSHCLKGNQYLSVGYMIRKLQFLGVHDSRRWSVWRRCFKAFYVFNLLSVLFDPLLYPLSLIL